MPSCLRALGFRRKKSKAHLTTTTNEKPKLLVYPGSAPGATKLPPLEGVPHAEVTHVQSTGVPVRPGVNPLYSAYSTPVNTRWADSAAAPPRPSDGMVESADKAVDPEEAALRKAAQEEQERLDFFQML